MKAFFDDTRPGSTATHGTLTFDLPILYRRDDLFGLYFTANCEKVTAAMPTDRLHPVTLPGGRAVVAVFAFNYIETSVGPYGEVAVAIPAVYGRKPRAGLLAALMEGRYPGFGALVYHLPVTRVEARDAGRGEWGYTKFIADMHFTLSPEHFECRLLEDNRHILDLRVARRGIYLKDRKPLITFSVKDGRLIRTVIAQQGVRRVAPAGGRSYLRLGDHPVADSIRTLGISQRPFLACYYPERFAILPAGSVLEAGVKPLDGYFGSDRAADHTVSYN